MLRRSLAIMCWVVAAILIAGVVLMAHGQPAWGVGAPKTFVYQLQDMAELARRLGAPISIDGSGNIIDQDDCEHGLVKGNLALLGTGAAITNDTKRARSGNHSYKFVAGSSSSHLAVLQRTFALPVASRIGGEVWFDEWNPGEALDLILQYYDGSQRQDAAIRLRLDTLELQYTGADGNYHTYRTLPSLGDVAWHWHGLKVTFDPTTGMYGRAKLDQYDDDLSAYAMYSVASAAAPQLVRQVGFTGRSGANDLVYIDDLIATQNEP